MKDEDEVGWNDRCPKCHANKYMVKEIDYSTLAVEMVCTECGYRILKGFGIIR